MDGALVVDGRRIAAFAERDPANLPWADLGVDLVLECTGVFKTEDDLTKHLQAGASYVILSAPTTSETVPTVVHGVNRPGRGNSGSSPAPAALPTASPRSSRSPTADSGSSVRVMTTVHAYTARPTARGRSQQELPARPGRRGKPGAHLDRGGESDHPRGTRARGQIRRDSGTRAHPGRVGGRHRLRRQPADHRR